MGVLRFFQDPDGSPSQSLSLTGRRKSGTGSESYPYLMGLLALLVLTNSAWAVGPGKESGAQDTATLELKGLLFPLHAANISSRSTGLIRTMKEEGDEVHKDEVVVSLDDDNEKLAVESGKAILEVRQSEYKTSSELAKKGSDSIQNANMALANLRTSDASLKQAVVALEKKSVHAPFDGVVTKRLRQPGEATDNYLPLLTMVDVSKLYLEIYLPSNRVPDVQPGQSVEVSVPDLPGKKFKGDVEFVAPVVDPASGEFRVKIVLDNSAHVLRAGMGAVGLLRLTGHSAELPTGAVTPPPGSASGKGN